MSLPPEAQILILNITIILVAYFGIYPTMRHLTVNRMMAIDLVLSLLSLAAAGGLFWGSGTAFSLLLFDTNWLVFSILTMMVMEWPFFLWTCRRRGLKPFETDGD